MRHLFVISLFSLALLGLGCEKATSMRMESAAPLEQIQTQAAHEAPAPPNTAVMYVHGMGCPQCANNVDVQLLKVKGVQAVKIDLGTGKVTAQLAPENPPSQEQLSNAIKNTGFTLVKIQMPTQS